MGVVRGDSFQGGNWPDWELFGVRIVQGGNCLKWELFEVRVVSGGNYSRR